MVALPLVVEQAVARVTVHDVEHKSLFGQLISNESGLTLKPIAWRLQYFDVDTGLQTGYVTISCAAEGTCQISERTDVGLPLSGR